MHHRPAYHNQEGKPIMAKTPSVEGQESSQSTHWSQGSSAQQATDPVCGMQVSPAEAEKAEHNGKTYHFCSSDCREQFEASPDDFEE
jgi:YHS domain-containing protein